MRKALPLLLGLLAYACVCTGQSCGCDKTLTASGIYRPISQGSGPFYLDLQPGDTVCIAAGNYSMLRFIGFQGTAEAPIVLKNCGGLVTIGHKSYYAALDFQGCRYFHVTGTGSAEHTYGIRIDSCGVASALAVGALSSDFEIDHIEVAKAGFAGMMMKTDPNCNAATWQGNFAMHNLDVHHNYVHDVGGEGFYIGNSFYANGMTIKCNGVNTQVYPHLIYGLRLHHNIVERSGAECIQYACAPDAQVHDNVATNCGIAPFAAFQNNGIQCGGGAGGDCYNNVVRNVGGSGLAVLGHLGNNRFFNNLLVNCGGDAIFCDDRNGSLPNTYCDFLNNTIVNAGRNAMRLYNQNNSILLANNVMVKAGSSFLYFLQGATATQQTNYTANSFVPGVFQDTLTMMPAPGSPLLNTGTDLAALGVGFDLMNIPRPVGSGFDIGCHEYCSGVPGICAPQNWYADTDGDGYGDAAVSVSAFPPAPVGFVSNYLDCDDTNPAINPAAAETCDNTDDDCNGIVDDEATDADTQWYPDADGDGFGLTDSVFLHCPELPGNFGSLVGGDCDDENPDIHPGAAEDCNLSGQPNTDDDCDGATDEDTSPPIARCRDAYLALRADGTAALSVPLVDDGSSDNCTPTGALTLAVSPNFFDCADAGAQTVVLTATDAAGQTTSCTATAHILDVWHHTETAIRTPSDGAAKDRFATGLALGGQWALGGAPDKKVGTQTKQGAAYVFLQNLGGPNNWGQLRKITASDGQAVDYFGNAAAFDGELLLVAAFGDNIGSNVDQGAAYLFEQNAGGPNNWGQTTKLLASDGVSYDYFGNALALRDHTAIVGASRRKEGPNVAQGAAYIFHKDGGGPGNWGQTQKLTASDAAPNNFFGVAISQADTLALVGASGNQNNRGAAYLFQKSPGTPGSWSETQKLTASDRAVGDGFGSSLALSGEYALVGAPNKNAYRGAAYIFKKDGGGSGNWLETRKLTASDGAAQDRFGSAVVLTGDYAYVGAPKANANTGAVYVFHKDAGGPDAWGEIGKYTASDAASADQFGLGLAADGPALFIGANMDDVAAKADQGSAYFFTGEKCEPSKTPQTGIPAAVGSPQSNGLAARFGGQPNPFSDALRLTRQSPPTDALAVQVYDLLGRCLARCLWPAGAETLDLQTEKWPIGLVTVQASPPGHPPAETAVLRLVKVF